MTSQRESLLHLSERAYASERPQCPVDGCPGPDVDHTGECAIGCGLERLSEECEA